MLAEAVRLICNRGEWVKRVCGEYEYVAMVSDSRKADETPRRVRDDGLNVDRNERMVSC